MERRDRVSTGLNNRRVDDTGGGALALAGTVTPHLNNTLLYVLEFDGSQCVAGGATVPSASSDGAPRVEPCIIENFIDAATGDVIASWSGPPSA